MSNRDNKLPIGSNAVWRDGKVDIPVTVLRHGRDAVGTYTEVSLPDGSKDRLHRSCLSSVPTSTPAPCKHIYKSRINRRPYRDPRGDAGYIADVVCKVCGELIRRDEKTCTNMLRHFELEVIQQSRRGDADLEAIKHEEEQARKEAARIAQAP